MDGRGSIKLQILCIKYVILICSNFAIAVETIKTDDGNTTKAYLLNNDGKLFVNAIFKKYGDGNFMSFEGFEHLLENLRIGNIKIDHGWIKHELNLTKLTEIHENHIHNLPIKNNEEKYHNGYVHSWDKTVKHNDHIDCTDKHSYHNHETQQQRQSNGHTHEREYYHNAEDEYNHRQNNDSNHDHKDKSLKNKTDFDKHQPHTDVDKHGQHHQHYKNDKNGQNHTHIHKIEPHADETDRRRNLQEHSNNTHVDNNKKKKRHRHKQKSYKHSDDKNIQPQTYNHEEHQHTNIKNGNRKQQNQEIVHNHNENGYDHTDYHEQHHIKPNNYTQFIQSDKNQTNRNQSNYDHHSEEVTDRGFTIQRVKLKNRDNKMMSATSTKTSSTEEANPEKRKEKQRRKQRNGKHKQKRKRKNKNKSKEYSNMQNKTGQTITDERYNMKKTIMTEHKLIKDEIGDKNQLVKHTHSPKRKKERKDDSVRNDSSTTESKRQHTHQNKSRGKRNTFDTLVPDSTQSDIQTDSDSIEKCFRPLELLHYFGFDEAAYMTQEEFYQICPAIVYQIDINKCTHSHTSKQHHHNEVKVENTRSLTEIPKEVWGYGTCAIAVISFSGLFVVSLIPLLRKILMTSLLQFLVALAVGALSGDALLHLIPHSLQPHDTHDHFGETHSLEGVYKCLCGLAAIYFFLLFGQIQTIVSKRKRKNKSKEKKIFDNNERSQMKSFISASSENIKSKTKDEINESDNDGHSDGNPHVHSNGNSHGHSHSVPSSIPALAWRVIIGDGVHNLCDGLAIGVAFANSVTGGISTSIAVLCHELPHEMGDFAVLLSKGMSVKQAILCNCISSVLSLIGMYIGILLGNFGQASLWIFVAVAGMFLYISLVDLIPELTNFVANGNNSEIKTLLVQMSGIITGSGIMFIIAIYEDDLMTVLDF